VKINNLLDSTCEACRVDAPKVTEEEIKELKPLVPSWEIIENNQQRKLICSFAFSSYKEGVSFANKIADLAEQEDHHPEILIEWGKVTVTWWSHKIKGLHKNDFIAAAKTDQIFSGS
jgi:4a-hydroxytetrahydrobiopterin dehydratase